MTNVYEGQPDARQSADVAEPMSRFRPRYRALTDDENPPPAEPSITTHTQPVPAAKSESHNHSEGEDR